MLASLITQLHVKIQEKAADDYFNSKLVSIATLCDDLARLIQTLSGDRESSWSTALDGNINYRL